MSAREATRPGTLLPFALAFGLAAPLCGLSGRLAPLPGFTSIEIGNDFVATVGVLWAAIMVWTCRESARDRRAWSFAAAGALLIAAEDHLEAIFDHVGGVGAELAASTTLWIVAAFLLFVCGRRHAMRRHVMTIMQAALAIEIIAIVLALVLGLALDPHAHRKLGRFQELCELSTTLLFVSALLATQIAPLKSYVFPLDEIGRRARSLFYDFGLETRRRYPTAYPLLALPVFSHLLTVAMILWFAPRAAREVARNAGRSVRGQILDMLRLGFVEGIDAKSYYVHELYLPRPRLVEGTITRVETKNGLNKAVQGLRAHCPGARDMNDKLNFWQVCVASGVSTAPILALIEEGVAVWRCAPAHFDRDLFVKERKGRGGRFTLNFERVAPFRYRDDAGAEVGFDEVMDRLSALSAERRLIVQPKLRNHPAIASLADKALVVFRVMTCMDQRGEPVATHGVLRLLRRFEPAWPKTEDADWGCSIDVATGEFGLMTGDAPETVTRWFADHPVTGERVAGRRLEGWREIAALARSAHRVFGARVLIGWDIAWTPDGAVILEGNSNPDFSYFQRVSRTPVAQSPLGPLLNHHLDALSAKLLAAEEPAAPSGERTSALAAGAKLAVDRFFEQGVGGQAAGALADVRFRIWRQSRPGATYAEFYVHRAGRTLERGGAHKTLGLRRYHADPAAGGVAQDAAGFASRGRDYFEWFAQRGLRPDMTCVDYGCGSLRVGRHFIRFLQPERYVGLDLVDRFYLDGVKLLEPGLLAEKRPAFSPICAQSIERVARRSPDLIYSTAVLHHVPPGEIEDYFRAIVSMMGPRTAAIANFKRGRRTARLGSSAWTHDPGSLLAAIREIEPRMLVVVDDDPGRSDDDASQAMIILARDHDVLRAWSARPSDPS